MADYWRLNLSVQKAANYQLNKHMPSMINQFSGCAFTATSTINVFKSLEDLNDR